MARLTLSAAEEYNFKLLGISCHAKDYRLSWAVNTALAIELEKPEGKEPIAGAIPDFLTQFSLFTYYDKDAYLDYALISNRGAAGFFVPEQKKTDYFLKVEGDIIAHRWDDIVAAIRKIDLVLAVYDIDIKTLKSKQNFLYINDN
jgi:hypothetical protein